MKFIIIILALLSILSQAKEISLVRDNSGPIQFYKDIFYLKAIQNPQEITSIVFKNTNSKGYSLKSGDLSQLTVLARFTNVNSISLDLSKNILVDDLDGLEYAFKNLVSLKELSLKFKHCSISDIKAIDYAFQDLISLTDFSLNLFDNKIGSVEDLGQFLQNSTKLQYLKLNFRQNKIDDDLLGLEQIFGDNKVPTLQVFKVDVSYNKIEDIDQISTFLKNTQNVEFVELILADNKIRSIEPFKNAFSGLNSLNDLEVDLRNNKIKNYLVLNNLGQTENVDNLTIYTNHCDYGSNYPQYTLQFDKNGNCDIVPINQNYQ